MKTKVRALILTLVLTLGGNAFDIISYVSDRELDNHYETTMDFIFNGVY